MESESDVQSDASISCVMNQPYEIAQLFKNLQQENADLTPPRSTGCITSTMTSRDNESDAQARLSAVLEGEKMREFNEISQAQTELAQSEAAQAQAQSQSQWVVDSDFSLGMMRTFHPVIRAFAAVSVC